MLAPILLFSLMANHAYISTAVLQPFKRAGDVMPVVAAFFAVRVGVYLFLDWDGGRLLCSFCSESSLFTGRADLLAASRAAFLRCPITLFSLVPSFPLWRFTRTAVPATLTNSISTAVPT